MVWWNGKKKGSRSLIACLGAVAGVLAFASATSAQLYYQSRSLIDAPTAGLLPPSSFETQTRVFPGGGVDFRFEVGLAHWVSVGAAYGGVQIIGDGNPDWNPEPGLFMKLRVLQESYGAPAIALGIDTQGSGYYDRSRERFQFKSRGIYLVASKNYAWYGDLTLHGGVSRSLEESDDQDPTPFVGLEKSLGSLFGLALEYDVATNDNRSDGAFGKGRGYLNMALRWNLAPQMQVRLTVRDMLQNSEAVDPRDSDVIIDEGWGREFAFSYTESF